MEHRWQDEMRRREHDPVRSDYSSRGNGGSPVPSLQRMLTALYEAEVDFNLASAWDAGFRLAIQTPRSDKWTSRGFTVGKAPHDFPSWRAAWDAAVFFICETVVNEWDNLEDGAPVDIGCLECTMNTTPVALTRGVCVYHIAKHVLKTHGLPKQDRP